MPSEFVLEQIGDAIIAMDESGRVSFWSFGAERMYGVPRGDALGRRLSDLYQYEFESNAMEREALEALERDGAWRGRNIHILRSGERRWVESTVTTLRDERGRNVGLVAVIRDDTTRSEAQRAAESERHQLEIAFRDRAERLESERRAREDAERAAKAAELFMAVLGHDLRSPLSALELGAAVVMKSSDERIHRTGERMRRSTARMTRMIEQLLDFSRLRIGTGLGVDREEMDLEALVSHVIEELTSGANARISVQARGNLLGRWDYDRLAQVFSNIIGNAIEHSHGDVRVTLDGDPSNVVVAVESAGAIPRDALPFVFEPFRQGRANAKSRGLGLGLFISREIVRAHGGTIDVCSDAETGTVFRVVVPRAG